MDRQEFDEQIGRKIKSLRALRKMRQVELAKKTGYSYQQIQKYESGANSVCPYNLDKISKIFCVNTNEFFNQESDLSILSNLTREQLNIVSLIIKSFAEINKSEVKNNV